MCEPMRNLRIHAIDIADSATVVQPVIDAAFAASDAACCATRKAAVSRAVYEAARQANLRIAWGDVLNPDAPDYIVWPERTIHHHTVADVLSREHAHEIRARDLAGAR